MPSKSELFSLKPVLWCQVCKGPIAGVGMSITQREGEWLCLVCFKRYYRVTELTGDPDRSFRYAVNIDMSGIPLKKQLARVEEWRQRVRSMIIR
jgi:hypothetical protein